MDQVTTGLRSVLSAPWAYDALQSVLGDRRARRRIATDHIRAEPGDVVVDIGCGTAQILKYLPKGIRYFGFDLSSEYIATARERHAHREGVRFECADINTFRNDAIPPCDLAIMFGVLHHVGDDAAKTLLAGLAQRLRPGGRLVTIDNVFVDGQNPLARKLIEMDRGQHVRSPEGYLSLPGDTYSKKQVTIYHDLLYVPYTHIILECTR